MAPATPTTSGSLTTRGVALTVTASWPLDEARCGSLVPRSFRGTDSWHRLCEMLPPASRMTPGFPHARAEELPAHAKDRDPVWNSLTFGDPNGVAMRLAGIEPAESSLHLSELVLSGCRCALSQADSQLGLGATDG